MRYIFLLAIVAALAGCGGTPQPSQQAVDQAMATIDAGLMPDATPTSIPLTEVDLEPLLIQAGDLPAGMTGAQVRTEPPKMFADVPEAAQALYQQIAQGSNPAGGVAVFLYESTDDVQSAYDVIWSGMDKFSSPLDIGEQAGGFAQKDTVGSRLFENSDILFRRCHAVVHIRMLVSDIALSTAYAKRLDKRLMPVVCQ